MSSGLDSPKDTLKCENRMPQHEERVHDPPLRLCMVGDITYME